MKKFSLNLDLSLLEAFCNYLTKLNMTAFPLSLSVNQTFV